MAYEGYYPGMDSSTNAADAMYRLMSMPDNTYSPGTAADVAFWGGPKFSSEAMAALREQQEGRAKRRSAENVAAMNADSSTNDALTRAAIALMENRTKVPLEMEKIQSNRELQESLKRMGLQETAFREQQANKRSDSANESKKYMANKLYDRTMDQSPKVNATLYDSVYSKVRRSMPKGTDQEWHAETMKRISERPERQTGGDKTDLPTAFRKQAAADMIDAEAPYAGLVGMAQSEPRLDLGSEAPFSLDFSQRGTPQRGRSVSGPDLRGGPLPDLPQVQYDPGVQKSYAGTGNYGNSGASQGPPVNREVRNDFEQYGYDPTGQLAWDKKSLTQKLAEMDDQNLLAKIANTQRYDDFGSPATATNQPQGVQMSETPGIGQSVENIQRNVGNAPNALKAIAQQLMSPLPYQGIKTLYDLIKMTEQQRQPLNGAQY